MKTMYGEDVSVGTRLRCMVHSGPAKYVTVMEISEDSIVLGDSTRLTLTQRQFERMFLRIACSPIGDNHE